MEVKISSSCRLLAIDLPATVTPRWPPPSFRSMLVQRPETAATKAAKANLVRCHGRFPHENLDDFLVTHGRFNMNNRKPTKMEDQYAFSGCFNGLYVDSREFRPTKLGILMGITLPVD